jgi:acyl-CoA synthetase (AMP-forming)/AMP-acid ligase II
MNIALLAEMAANGFGERAALGRRAEAVTYNELFSSSQRVAALLAETPADNVVLIDTNSPALVYLLFGAALAERPFAPVNYRLANDRLAAILQRLSPAIAVVDPAIPAAAGAVEGVSFLTRDELLAALPSIEPRPDLEPGSADPDAPAVLVFTSGTSGEPKAAVLRHSHLFSYVISTVEFMGAGEEEATLVSVPPYHVAGIAAVLTGVYAGRRMIQLESFDAAEWVAIARSERVTHAMVVPTMLERILDVLDQQELSLPDLRHLSYGGGRMPLPTIERALSLLGETDLVNAYGLTETSSTIALLTPEDHRVAFAATDPAVHNRLSSVGRPIEGLELEIRDETGRRLGPGEAGSIHVRGPQVAGEYVGAAPALVDGWFATNDGGYLDADGYLYLLGRLDDVIVRGGENISPGEVEDALLSHPAVREAGVVGLPDTNWGEVVVAAVVPEPGAASVSEEELKEWVRARLRSSRTPAHIVTVEALPYTDTGKLVRRVLRTELEAALATSS